MIPVSYQPEPEFRLITGFLVLYSDWSSPHKGFVDLFYDLWIQKSHHFYGFWIQKLFCPFLQFLDPETAVFLRFLDPESAPFLRFLDPEFFLSISTISGSRNCSISAVSGSRNRTISTISGSRNFLVHIHNFWIQKLQYFCSFWIQKLHHFCNFWIIKWARENVPPRLLPTNGLGAADKWMMVTIFGWWPQGHHPRMVTIIHLSPGSTQPAVHTIHTRLGGPSPRSFP